MYLSDRQLTQKLVELEIECDESHPFDEARQLQPASIDLRLSNVFWIPRRGVRIDLLKEVAVQRSPFRFWDRQVHTHAKPIELLPGDVVLARVHEKLSIPRDCAGKFEGRSSYARLGLAIHCTGDFANPGYRGHMPLQLVNNGPFTLRIYPYMPICQLMLVTLSSPSMKKYGGDDTASKYMNDNGGPSYWWREKYIEQLRNALKRVDYGEILEAQIYTSIADVEPEVLERLSDFLNGRNPLPDETARKILSEFSEKEALRQRRDQNSWRIWLGLVTIPVGGIWRAMASDPINAWLLAVMMIVVVVLVYMTVHAFRKPRPTSYFTPAELNRLKD